MTKLEIEKMVTELKAELVALFEDVDSYEGSRDSQDRCLLRNAWNRISRIGQIRSAIEVQQGAWK